tara:strand:- start:82 stop:1392 length:1311 start_codon:yes stop_codon:yes gene_type:complete
MNPEAEPVRRLVYHDSSLSFEGVATNQNGDVVAVTPDKPALLYFSALQPRPSPTFISVDNAMKPEAVKLSDAGHAYIYDDATQQVRDVQLGSVKRAAPRNVHPEHREYSVKPNAETTPVNRFGDAADDPAIWVNQTQPQRSLILGTDKKFGLNVYSLSGKRVQTLPVGRVNNVDIRYGVNWQGQIIDIAAASNRSNNHISVFAISPESGDVSHIGDIPTTLTDVYGLCMYQYDGTTEVFINSTDGQFQRYRLVMHNENVQGELIESFTVPSQPEGCVADDARQQLFFGEEATGIWHRDLKAPGKNSTLIARIGGDVEADIEGMALFEVNSLLYLIASSQGNNRYAVYQASAPWGLVGTFSIVADYDNGLDGATETDGLDITNASLGSRYPKGMMVVQDGHNILPSDKQNFKLVDGSAIESVITEMQAENQAQLKSE